VFFHTGRGNVLPMSLRLEIILLLLAWLFFIVTHQFFLYFSFFWYFWWADILLHTWGGALIVMSWYTIFRTRTFPQVMALSYNHPLIVLSLMMIGWEIFEYVFGIANTTNYLGDTALDLVTGALGGIVVFYLFKSRTIDSN
jgi:hypothetical protein